MKLFRDNHFLSQIVLISFLALGCNDQNYREVNLGDIIAKGDITKDTVYNGNIEFYNSRTNRKTGEQYYIRGIPNGKYKKYGPHGVILYECNYVHGKILGNAFAYTDEGKLADVNYFYYDIPMGPVIHYNNDKVQEYSFYSFDGELLFNLNYDSLSQRRITDIQKNYFFVNRRGTTSYESGSTKSKILDEIFVYKLCPTHFDFQYDLVIVNNKYENAKIVHQFKKGNSWEICDFPTIESSSNRYYALRLVITDSLSNNSQITMFKYLR